ncbi:MAG: hypothetical protein CML39_02470 [Rhodobacteraceae bacterium]|nr:MAG: hypothetical protein CML39_02470 [Paracoccaceae bacterium]
MPGVNLVKNYLKIVLPTAFILISMISLFNLISAMNGVSVEKHFANENPVIIFTPNETRSDILVFVAHGFAGSASLMKSIALSLAKTGHRTLTFDFLGHGRHSLPYSGDIMTEKGATKLFVRQINDVINFYLKKEGVSQAVIIGHSMASDLIFRTARLNHHIIGTIGISNYTDMIKRDKPSNVLIANGMWEPSLRNKAIDILKSIGIESPQEDVVYGSFQDRSARKITSIENADHVGILYSSKTQMVVNNWINDITGQKLKVAAKNIGIWALLLFFSLFCLFLIFVQNIPKQELKRTNINFNHCIVGNVIASIFTPFLLSFYSIDLLPFTAHNYLLNHLFLYAFLGFLFTKGSIASLPLDNFNLLIFTGLVIFFTLILGGVLDQYVSTFHLSDTRVPIFFLLLIGSIPITFFVQLFYQNCNAGVWKASLSKLFLILSLAFAMFLNFGELFLLGYAILLLLAFWLVFTFLSHLVLRRTGSYLSIALANGVTLSWTLSTALPLYLP